MNVIIEEEVLVPAIVQEPNEVEEVIDPAWREYVYNVEDKFVNVIITEYPMYPPILTIAYSQNNSELRHYIGEELITPITIDYYTDIIFLNDYKETGIDSQGRRFWVFDSRLVPHIQFEAVDAAGMRVLQLLQAFLAAGHRNDGPAFLNKTFGGGPADSRRSSGDIRDWHGKLL